jgi:fascin 1/2
MQARNATVGKDELFMVDESHPQVFITAHNGKMVSIKQGVDPTANQDDELTDREMYQLEFDKKAEQWRIRTADNKYWSVEAASGIQAIGTAQGLKGLFTIEWLADGRAALKAACNGRYVTARMNGSLYAVSDELADRERFTLTLVNRPRLVLKCDHGYVGFKSATNARYECNKAASDPVKLISLLKQQQGQTAETLPLAAYCLQGHNDRYWTVDPVDGSSLIADSVTPQPFILELCGMSRVAIRAPNGNYISAEQNGTMWAKHAELEKATLWEY